VLSFLVLMLNNRFYAVDQFLFSHFGRSEYDLYFDADVQAYSEHNSCFNSEMQDDVYNVTYQAR
jgi:hypothetical protein